jgi:hypothetical protein
MPRKLNDLVRMMVVCFFFLQCSSLYAQTITPGYSKVPDILVGSNVNGYIRYLPTDYLTTTQRYPLLIMFVGMNSHGSGSETDLNKLFSLGSGLPTDQFLDGTWVEEYSVNGQSYKFIVIAPQFKGAYDVAATEPTPSDVNDVINHAIATYRVDTTRIYLTGNSSGGGPTILYAGSDSTGSTGYGKRIAAIVPFSAAYLSNNVSQAKANVYRENNIAVWAFHNIPDPGPSYLYSELFVNQINTPTPSYPPAKLTLFNPGWGEHDSWFGPYTRLWVDPSSGLNIYQWMLQYSRTFSTVLPVNFLMFNAACENGRAKLTWKTTGEVNVQRFAIERSENGNTWIEVGSLPPSGASSGERTYNFKDPAQASGFYRIVEHSYDGRKTISSVIRNGCKGGPSFTIFPNPASEKIVINVTLEQRSKMNYYITDSKGAVILRKESILEAGLSQVPVSLNGIAKGIYTLHAHWGSENQALNFLKN